LGLKSNDELKLHDRLTSLKMAIKDEEKIVSELQTKKPFPKIQKGFL